MPHNHSIIRVNLKSTHQMTKLMSSNTVWLMKILFYIGHSELISDVLSWKYTSENARGIWNKVWISFFSLNSPEIFWSMFSVLGNWFGRKTILMICDDCLNVTIITITFVDRIVKNRIFVFKCSSLFQISDAIHSSGTHTADVYITFSFIIFAIFFVGEYFFKKMIS